jgi:hypothetical protein
MGTGKSLVSLNIAIPQNGIFRPQMTADGSTNPWCCLRLQRSKQTIYRQLRAAGHVLVRCRVVFDVRLIGENAPVDEIFQLNFKHQPFVFWLVVWNMCYFSLFSIYWECHHPK